MKKNLTYIFTIILIFSVLSVTAWSQNQVTIEWWELNGDPHFVAITEELISRFEQENPDINVNLVALPWAQAAEKLNIAAATNSLPDISSKYIVLIQPLVAMDVLEPLDAYFDNWEEKDKFDPELLESIRTVCNGKLGMLPRNIRTDNYYFNVEHFEEAGLTPPNTMEDLYAVMSRLTDPAKGRYGFSMRGGHGNYYQLSAVALNDAGITSYFDENGVCLLN